jgi:hypothetical protein
MCAPGKLPRKTFSETPHAYLLYNDGEADHSFYRCNIGNQPGDSSWSGGHRILAGQLSLRMEFAVDRSAIGDPDCGSIDPKRVSLASQEYSSQDCLKENSYLFS